MKVRVKEVRTGFFAFYGGMRRYPGDEFPLEAESHFSKAWMEKVEEVKPEVKPVEKAKPKSKSTPKSRAKPKQEEGGE